MPVSTCGELKSIVCLLRGYASSCNASSGVQQAADWIVVQHQNLAPNSQKHEIAPVRSGILWFNSHPAGDVLVVECFSESQQAPRGFHLEAHRDVASIQQRLHQQRATSLRWLPLDILQVADTLVMRDAGGGESLTRHKLLLILSVRIVNE